MHEILGVFSKNSDLAVQKGHSIVTFVLDLLDSLL